MYLSWANRNKCANKEQAMSMVCDRIQYAHDEYNERLRELDVKEIEAFAKEWNIPFCWDLHEKLLNMWAPRDTWNDSGCSWDSSGC